MMHHESKYVYHSLNMYQVFSQPFIVAVMLPWFRNKDLKLREYMQLALGRKVEMKCIQVINGYGG